MKKLGDDFLNKPIFEVALDNKTVIGSVVSINLVNAKLSSIVQKTPLDDYLSNNVDVHKIIICKDVAKKVVKQIVSEYKNAKWLEKDVKNIWVNCDDPKYINISLPTIN
jgi:hypothetical protein